MLTSLQILQATPLWDELVEYCRSAEGREVVLELRRKRAYEEACRLAQIDHIKLLFETRLPSYRDTEWLSAIEDVDFLERMFRDLLGARNDKALRAVITRYRAAAS